MPPANSPPPSELGGLFCAIKLRSRWTPSLLPRPGEIHMGSHGIQIPLDHVADRSHLEVLLDGGVPHARPVRQPPEPLPRVRDIRVHHRHARRLNRHAPPCDGGGWIRRPPRDSFTGHNGLVPSSPLMRVAVSPPSPLLHHQSPNTSTFQYCTTLHRNQAPKS